MGGSEKSEDGGGSSPGTSPTSGCPSCRQLLCSCVKSSAGLLNYQRLASSVPSLVYHGGSNHNPNNPYSPEQVAYLAAAAAAAEHSALYAVAGGGLSDVKEGGLGPSSWGYPSVYHPYDPGFAAAAAAAAAAYPFNGYAVDVNGSRRKNATRETTSTLKAWLAEHKKNPYPTKGEKIMLAIITKMTLTQVSTWFANARRRLKKENKMTWEPRNRPDDDDDVDISDSEQDKKPSDDTDNERLGSTNTHAHGKSSPTGSSCSDGSKEGTTPTPNNQKPRIWSLADLAGSGSGSTGAESHQGSRRHNNLPGSAFSPLSRSSHSESIYRGLYPLPHPAYHPDNP
ncbi:unnamed protein product [Allacma fusca]|uniref:Homeobox domain-containing protein n=1 Tax=Allacma fusca TaxID=39272 RepID=A0A8J2JPZ6_9HEXA|nr:unnamed protein product [Allacma fusca]